MRLGTQLVTGLAAVSAVLMCPAVATALTSAQVSNIAKAMTVRIDGADGSNGSGFIVESNGDRYKILTCRHVVEYGESFTVTTADQKRHKVTNISMEPFGENLDLAVIEFSSGGQYPVANIGDSNQVQAGQNAYVAGFPARGSSQQPAFLLFNEGKINAKAGDSLQNGYELVYNINTLPGMSGGPVLNDQGQVIGVHGQGDQAEDVTVLLEASEVNPGVVVKSGFNYAIPINTFKKFAPIAKVTFTEKRNIPSPTPRPGGTTLSAPPTPAPKPVPKPQPLVATLQGTYDPTELIEESLDNRARFEQKYGNKIFAVQGYVSSVNQVRNSPGFFVNLKSTPKTPLHRIGLSRSVYCQGVPPEVASQLNKKDFVTVQGLYKGDKTATFNLSLKNCQVIKR